MNNVRFTFVGAVSRVNLGDKWPRDTNLVRDNGSFEKVGFREIELRSFRSTRWSVPSRKTPTVSQSSKLIIPSLEVLGKTDSRPQDAASSLT